MKIQVESTITGYREILSLQAFYKKFGKLEGKEILAGYDSSILAFKIKKEKPND